MDEMKLHIADDMQLAMIKGEMNQNVVKDESQRGPGKHHSLAV